MNHVRINARLFGLKIAAISSALLVPALSASAVRPCPPDTDCSGAVNVTDLLAVIGAWGQTGGSADIDGSGGVDVTDLLSVIGAWGPCQFNFGPAFIDTEAHQIGLELVESLTLPADTYDRVARDLNLIRLAYPALAGEFHSPAWEPTQMLAAVIQGSDLTEYQCANTYYQMIDDDLIFSSGGVDYYALTFAGKANMEALSAIYSNLPGLSFAEPNGFIGGDNRWTPTDMGGGVWKWNIDDGFMDCFDGCDCHRVYDIDIDAAGVVTLVNYEEWGMKWCKW
jgi:hypothetical protein